jgi:hypothetical protein
MRCLRFLADWLNKWGHIKASPDFSCFWNQFTTDHCLVQIKKDFLVKKIQKYIFLTTFG